MDACLVDLQERVTAAFGAPLYNLWEASETLGSLNYGLRPGPVTRIVKGAQTRLMTLTAGTLETARSVSS